MTNGTTHQLFQDFKDQPAKPTTMSKPGPKELRIVLIGMTERATSKIENILREHAAQKDFNMVLVQTVCQDSPSQVNKEEKNEKVSKNIDASIFTPGLHVFLYVHKWMDGFIKHDVGRIELVKEFFGKESLRYFLPLIDHEKRELEKKDIEKIMSFFEKHFECGKEKYCEINLYSDKALEEEIAKKIADKISEVVNENGPECYTEDMFKKAQEEFCKKLEEAQKQRKKDGGNNRITKLFELFTDMKELARFLDELNNKMSGCCGKITEKMMK